MKDKITPTISREEALERKKKADERRLPMGIDLMNLKKNISQYLIDNCTIQYEREELFEKLQTLNEEHGDGQRWPTARNNLNAVLEKNIENDYTRRAWYLYDRILFLSGKESAVSDLGYRMNPRHDWYRVRYFAYQKYQREKNEKAKKEDG